MATKERKVLKKISSIAVLLVGYLGLLLSLEGCVGDKYSIFFLGLYLVSLGTYSVISDFGLLKYRYFQKRPGALLLLFVLPMVLFVLIQHLVG
ncbi:MAG: hypothetical protein QM305_04625 [Bacteroidota bacterium]|nr:hypothetical protein [Bacteroidota bacterium]